MLFETYLVELGRDIRRQTLKLESHNREVFHPHSRFIGLVSVQILRRVGTTGIAVRRCSRKCQKFVNSKGTYSPAFRTLLLFDLHNAPNCPQTIRSVCFKVFTTDPIASIADNHPLPFSQNYSSGCSSATPGNKMVLGAGRAYTARG